ncbi:MAG: helix-turn-helix domain-containing protein [Planctomycetota bacterium]|nr:helix-turn-helix domain-containing protein [Planctomycetota bacterium]
MKIQTTSPERLAIPASEVAKLLSVSERHVWTLHATGRLPRPIRLGRSVRWDYAELLAWMKAGAPPRARWEQMRRRNGQ